MFDILEIKDVRAEIGQQVRKIRKSTKMSQSELAERIGSSRYAIQHLEAGQNFTIDTLLKALKEFGLLHELFQQLHSSGRKYDSTQSLY